MEPFWSRIAMSLHGVLSLVVVLMVLSGAPRTVDDPRGRRAPVPVETGRLDPPAAERRLTFAKPDAMIGPTKDLRYRVTRVGTNYGRRHPSGRRTTWELSLSSDRVATVHVVREATDDELFLNTDIQRGGWRVVGEARYLGSCEGDGCARLHGEEVTVSDDFSIHWIQESATGALTDSPDQLAWRCTRSLTKTLHAEARFHHGECSGPGGLNAWVPSARAERVTLRCDGEKTTEPRADTPGDEAWVKGALVGLHFGERGGIEWVDEMQDCPVRGAFRDLPAPPRSGS
jgi:hypothetical protein